MAPARIAAHAALCDAMSERAVESKSSDCGRWWRGCLHQQTPNSSRLHEGLVRSIDCFEGWAVPIRFDSAAEACLARRSTSPRVPAVHQAEARQRRRARRVVPPNCMNSRACVSFLLRSSSKHQVVVPLFWVESIDGSPIGPRQATICDRPTLPFWGLDRFGAARTAQGRASCWDWTQSSMGPTNRRPRSRNDQPTWRICFAWHGARGHRRGTATGSQVRVLPSHDGRGSIGRRRLQQFGRCRFGPSGGHAPPKPVVVVTITPTITGCGARLPACT